MILRQTCNATVCAQGFGAHLAIPRNAGQTGQLPGDKCASYIKCPWRWILDAGDKQGMHQDHACVMRWSSSRAQVSAATCKASNFCAPSAEVGAKEIELAIYQEPPTSLYKTLDTITRDHEARKRATLWAADIPKADEHPEEGQTLGPPGTPGPPGAVFQSTGSLVHCSNTLRP